MLHSNIPTYSSECSLYDIHWTSVFHETYNKGSIMSRKWLTLGISFIERSEF